MRISIRKVTSICEKELISFQLAGNSVSMSQVVGEGKSHSTISSKKFLGVKIWKSKSLTTPLPKEEAIEGHYCQRGAEDEHDRPIQFWYLSK